MPNLLPSGASALELVHDIIVANTTPAPVDGVNMFIGYAPSTTTLNSGYVYEILEGFQNPKPMITMGMPDIALDIQTVDLQVTATQPTDSFGPRNECRRLRYVIAGLSLNYVSQGLRMLYAESLGQVTPMGRDSLERPVYMCSFNCWTEPAHV